MAMAIDDGGQPRRALVWIGGAFLSLFLFGAVVALSYNLGAREGDIGKMPLIEAAEGPLKVTPENPGGETFPHQDIAVYGRISGEQEPVLEQLMPPAEEPAMPEEPRVIDDGAGPNELAAGDDGDGAAAGSDEEARDMSMEDLLKRDALDARRDSLSGTDTARADAAPSDDAGTDGANVDTRVAGSAEPPASRREPNTEAASAEGEPAASEQVRAAPTGTVEVAELPAASERPSSMTRVVETETRAESRSEPERAEATPRVLEQADAEPQPGPEGDSEKTEAEAEPERTTVARAEPEIDAVAPSPAAKLEGIRIQIGSFRSREQAEEAWQLAAQKHKDLLAGLQPAIPRADLGQRGVYHRVQVGPFESRAEAASLCKLLDQRGQACIVAAQ